MVLTDGEGASHTYLSNGGGGYTPPAGEDGVLAATAPTGWTLPDSDGSVYVFDATGPPVSARSAADSAHQRCIRDRFTGSGPYVSDTFRCDTGSVTLVTRGGVTVVSYPYAAAAGCALSAADRADTGRPVASNT